MRESRCYFFCHTPKKWGVRYPHSKKWGVRVPLVSYAYAPVRHTGCTPIPVGLTDANNVKYISGSLLTISQFAGTYRVFTAYIMLYIVYFNAGLTYRRIGDALLRDKLVIKTS